MMRQGHAVSGLAAGLGMAGLAPALGMQLSLPTALIGAALTAGAALLPDIDCPGATVTRTFGIPSMLLAESTNAFSAWIYERTATEHDEERDGGHRGITHTLVFALVLGGLCALFARVTWIMLLILFVCIALTLQGLLGKRARVRLPFDGFLPDKLGLWIVSALLTGALWFWLPEEFSPLFLGALVAFGCLVHCVGDALTLSGCPIAWPIPIAGQRWYPIGTPEAVRFRAGGAAEVYLVLPLLTLTALVLLIDTIPGAWALLGWAWSHTVALVG